MASQTGAERTAGFGLDGAAWKKGDGTYDGVWNVSISEILKYHSFYVYTVYILYDLGVLVLLPSTSSMTHVNPSRQCSSVPDQPRTSSGSP